MARRTPLLLHAFRLSFRPGTVLIVARIAWAIRSRGRVPWPGSAHLTLTSMSWMPVAAIDLKPSSFSPLYAVSMFLWKSG